MRDAETGVVEVSAGEVSAVTWSALNGVPCIRVVEARRGGELVVRPRSPGSLAAGPGTAGAVVDEGGDRCFVPRYPFVEGTSYEVIIDETRVGVLEHPRIERSPVARVLSVYPTAADVPVNLLRLSVHFSHPMSEGTSSQHIRLLDESGEVIPDALLKSEYELWDADRRRLTLLLDPGRIKRGLVDHEASGYPLRRGSSFTVVVDEGFPDATGACLVSAMQRTYGVAGAEHRRLSPAAWGIRVPRRETREAIRIEFDRPMDRALMARCLAVMSPSGAALPGTAEVGSGEGSWSFTPDGAWSSGKHVIRVDPVLEDTAGNSITRVFDRELAVADGGSPITELAFTPGP